MIAKPKPTTEGLTSEWYELHDAAIQANNAISMWKVARWDAPSMDAYVRADRIECAFVQMYIKIIRRMREIDKELGYR